MRKVIFILLIGALLFGCTNSTTKEEKKETTTKDSTAKDTTNPNAQGATNAQY